MKIKEIGKTNSKKNSLGVLLETRQGITVRNE